MQREALADRVVTYSDAVVAFGLVNGLAFLLALGESDIRCSIAGIAVVVAATNVAFALAMTYALVWLRRYELLLREAPADTGKESEAEDEPKASHDPLVDRFSRITAKLRLGLVWFFTGVVLLGVWAATHDSRCVAGIG